MEKMLILVVWVMVQQPKVCLVGCKITTKKKNQYSLQCEFPIPIGFWWTFYLIVLRYLNSDLNTEEGKTENEKKYWLQLHCIFFSFNYLFESDGCCSSSSSIKIRNKKLPKQE